MMFSLSKALCLLMIIYLVSSECKVEGYKPPPKCARVECPPYSVVHSEREFEIRSYKDALWMSSPKISETSYLGGYARGASILTRYYYGNNSQHVEIDIRSPFLVDIQPALAYVQNSFYTVSYYIPQKYQKSIPTPISPELKPVKLPKQKYVAVRRFPGDLTDDNISIQIDALKKSLQGTPYQQVAALDLFTVAQYDMYGFDEDGFFEVFLPFD